MTRTSHILSVMLLLLVSSAVNMHFSTRISAEKEQVLYFPAQEGFRMFTAGYDRAIADMLWMRLLAFFGGHYADPASLENLGNMLAAITDLNPRHESAYYMSAVILPWMADDLAMSRYMLARAMAWRPREGRWDYFMGFNQYLFAGDKRSAAHYLERAIRKGYVNRMTAALATRLKAETAGLSEARAYLRRALAGKQDEKVRKFLQRQLLTVETEMVLRKLDQFVARLSSQGIHIHSVQALKEAGLVWPDVLPDGGQLAIGENGMLFSTANPRRLKLFRSRTAARLQQRESRYE